ncbi:MAG: purine-nucleoside phosphorylase [Candidatus Cloacimonadota bacterium]|nr:purine-nucleoside phosphorylase [Candidatus Cloacimonadota bacterium]
MIEKLKIAADKLLEEFGFQPEIAFILGTGLSELISIIEEPVMVEYKKIPGMVVSTAPSHKGQFVGGSVAGKKVVFMQGRLHFYEGYSMQQVTYPIRLLKTIGVKKLFITNAAGSLKKDMSPGDLVLLKDHLNLMGTNPLIGKNLEDMGERFPSLHQPYDRKIRNEIKEICYNENIKFHEGVYAAVTGPSLETEAECKMLTYLGADIVGMSTVPEVIVGIHAGLKIVALSVVTNYSNLFHSEQHSQEEIRKNALKAKQKIQKIITELVKNI